MLKKCLMLETQDHRKFFTHQKNLPDLIEFSKIFNAEISIVRTNEQPIDLISLAEVVCDNNETHKPDFEILEVKVSRLKRNRRKLIKQAKVIRKWIKLQLVDGQTVCTKSIIKKYKKYGLSPSAICNHFTEVRKELTKEGFRVKNEGRGNYRLF
jgi:hypothetical protein